MEDALSRIVAAAGRGKPPPRGGGIPVPQVLAVEHTPNCGVKAIKYVLESHLQADAPPPPPGHLAPPPLPDQSRRPLAAQPIRM
jgi:hypothetical protein